MGIDVREQQGVDCGHKLPSPQVGAEAANTAGTAAAAKNRSD